MRLVYSATGEEVIIGDTVVLRDDRKVVVSGITKPHKSSSTGRVYVKAPGDEFEAEFFPSVIGAEWIDREDIAPESNIRTEITPEINKLFDIANAAALPDPRIDSMPLFVTIDPATGKHVSVTGDIETAWCCKEEGAEVVRVIKKKFPKGGSSLITSGLLQAVENGNG